MSELTPERLRGAADVLKQLNDEAGIERNYEWRPTELYEAAHNRDVTIASTIADIDESQAYLRNALEELAELRSDVISELGHSASDSFLKASFLERIGVVELNIRRANQ